MTAVERTCSQGAAHPFISSGDCSRLAEGGLHFRILRPQGKPEALKEKFGFLKAPAGPASIIYSVLVVPAGFRHVT